MTLKLSCLRTSQLDNVLHKPAALGYFYYVLQGSLVFCPILLYEALFMWDNNKIGFRVVIRVCMVSEPMLCVVFNLLYEVLATVMAVSLRKQPLTNTIAESNY